MPRSVENIFNRGEAHDLHVNVGHDTKYGFFDGDPNEEAVRRQFSAYELKGSKLSLIGLRTHYSYIDIPNGCESKFIPSISINWIGMKPELFQNQLANMKSSRTIIWFQSFRDPYHRSVMDPQYKQAIAAYGKDIITVSHTGEHGELTPETLQILEIARSQNAIIATPHSNPERSLPLIFTAASMGLTVLWVHPDSRLINTPAAMQEAVVKQFPNHVYVERAAVFLRDGKKGYYSAEKIVCDARKIGMHNVVFTSDLGRHKEADPLMPDEGLQWYLEQLTDAGLTLEEAYMGISTNPMKLINQQS